MKIKLLISTLLLASSCIQAQSFEGTIEWKMAFEITDPKIKKDMADAEKQLNDPKNRAQMEELKKQMEDPEMKAMLESNPQMKEQMEKMLTMTQNGGGISSMMPTGLVIKTKNNNSLATVNGGIAHTTLSLASGESYTINHDAKTYAKIANTVNQKADAPEKYVITKTGETAKILNYNCTKYKVIYTEQNKTITNYVWATTEIKDIDWQKMKNSSSFKRNSEWMNKIEGVPLKMQVQEETASITMEVVKMQKETLNNDLFKLPVGYKEVPASAYGLY